jgi:hypothetical protein
MPAHALVGTGIAPTNLERRLSAHPRRTRGTTTSGRNPTFLPWLLPWITSLDRVQVPSRCRVPEAINRETPSVARAKQRPDTAANLALFRFGPKQN